MSADLVQLVTSLAQRARAASLALAIAPTAAKNAALVRLADLLTSSTENILSANQKDLDAAKENNLSAAQVDRLTLTSARLATIAESVRQVATLPDPVGELLEETTRPNGLVLRKIRVPIGVIGIVYEARPNVTIDCAVLCLKSGNAAILRGGKESFHTNTALAALIQQAIATSELGTPNPEPGTRNSERGTPNAQFKTLNPEPGTQPSEFGGENRELKTQNSELVAGAVQLIPTTDRAALITLLKLDTLVHCIIPRGGEGLIRFVAENSTIPVIKHFKGVCFIYVDRAADFAMAEKILVNAKISRPGVCNAAEQLLIHRNVAEEFLPAAARALLAKNVQLRCDAASAAILARANLAHTPATDADYTTEFLDYILAVRVTDSLDSAIATVNRDSSNHTDAIITSDAAAAQKFLAAVDSAAVIWNASTRFNDGFEFGLGAEIGISTDRLHARGPMGLRELCSYKWQVTGTGQVRS